jgi:hypothetical protein
MKKILLCLTTFALFGCTNNDPIPENTYVDSQQQVQGIWKLESQFKGYSTINTASACDITNASLNFNAQTVTEKATSINITPCNVITGSANKYSVVAGTLVVWQGTFTIKYNIAIKSGKLVLLKREVDSPTMIKPIYYTEENQTTETYIR